MEAAQEAEKAEKTQVIVIFTASLVFVVLVSFLAYKLMVAERSDDR